MIHHHVDQMKHAMGVVFLAVCKELLAHGPDSLQHTLIPKRFLTNVSPADVNPNSMSYELNDIKQDQQVNINYGRSLLFWDSWIWQLRSTLRS